MDKLLTIVIPTYNMQDYLRKCLDSLIIDDEKMPFLEVLVINDGSKDNSSAIAHEYESRFVCNMGFRSDDSFVNSKCLLRDWATSTIYMKFEDISIPIPQGYDNILTKLYGDYMTPAQEPNFHGGFLHLNADIPYGHYLHFYKKQRRSWKSK